MTKPSSPSQCPACGAAIPAKAPHGLCPKCLLLDVAAPTEPTASHEGRRAAPPALETVAAAFPHLEIIEVIGQGGMGCVYKARQPQLNRFVALKILPESLAADSAFADRFAREAQALAALSHPHIVTIHDFGQAGGFFYLLMEYVDGANLRQALRAGRFTPEQALSMVPPICEALQFAHERGIVHRDIKPENLLLDKQGKLKIADFGVAKMVGAAPATAERHTVGTPQYMAPEQRTQPEATDHRADIYSLGVVLYEMLTGELPGKSLEPPSSQIHGVQINVRLDEVVLRALEKSPELRWQTAAEFQTNVEQLMPLDRTAPCNTATDPAGDVPDKPSPHEKRRQENASNGRPSREALLALSLFLAGTLGTLLLMTISHRHELALIFGGLALLLALIFASISRRERLGKGILIGTGLLAVSGALAMTFLFFGLPWERAEAERMKQELIQRQSEQARETELAAATNWSPSLAPGEIPDIDKIRMEAKELAARGLNEEALQHHIWYHHHALEYSPAHSAVRLSFALSDWIDLGQRYPKARQSLINIRNRQTDEILAGRGYFESFQEVASINHYLQNEDATLALFKAIAESDPALARQCYHAVEDLLVERGEYDLAFRFLPDHQKHFDRIRQGRDSHLPLVIANPQGTALDDSQFAELVESRFLKKTLQLIEILVAAGRIEDAESIRRQALAIDDHPRLKTAIADAAARLSK